MKIDKTLKDFRRRILPLKAGAALLLLFCLFVAAANWIAPATPEEKAAMTQQDSQLFGESPEQSAAAGLATAERADLPWHDGASADDTAEIDEAQAAAAYFAAYRLDREEARSAELLVLEQIIADQNSSAEAIGQAEERRLTIAAYSDQENQAESLLSAKGFGETVVILGEQRATVIVDVEMNAQKATQIAEVVDGASGCGFENVVVVNR